MAKKTAVSIIKILLSRKKPCTKFKSEHTLRNQPIICGKKFTKKHQKWIIVLIDQNQPSTGQNVKITIITTDFSHRLCKLRTN